MKNISRLLIIIPLFTSLFSQGRTIGTRLLNPLNHPPVPGYKLIYMHGQPNVYLIDEWGEAVHVWRDTLLFPGNAAFLTEEGKLYKTSSRGRNANPSFQAGGSGDFLQIRDWDNTLLWNYEYSDSTVRMHHDIRPMPNGNALILAFESISRDSAIALGRDTTILGNVLWLEHIIEVEPVGIDSGNIVWEWHALDHLIQDHDSTKANFGVVRDHLGKIDINYDTNANPDWLHANAIDYNPYLDQILVCAPGMSEVWIIDHSQTTAATADSAGDLIYRWGNPEAYHHGTANDTKLFWQHDAHWVRDNSPDSGKIMIFNNRYGGNYSAVVMIDPPKNPDGTYTLGADTTYLPSDFDYIWTAPNPTDFFSSFISGSQQLPNGNLLVCKGAFGEVFEVNAQSDTLWMWIKPISNGNVLTQGNSVPVNPNNGRNTNLLFRAHHYGTDFAGFAGRDLAPMGTIEHSMTLDIVVNEFIASTDSCCADQAGENEDFIELMNIGNDLASLSSLFFTDDEDELTKHRLGVRYHSNGFNNAARPLLWADNDLDQGMNHLGFKLSSEGEFIGIHQVNSYWYNGPRLLVVDTLSFGEQDTDVSYGRYPDGSDIWQQMNPTPGFTNTQELNVKDFITVLAKYSLHQNFPNPFNPTTTLRYDIPENAMINITIYDMLGRHIKTLMDQTQDAGYKSVIWNATNDYGKPVSAGIYLYQIQAGEYISTKKMVLLK